jgi:glycosyltransferase involved in cell wall biosynthesis
MPETLGVPRERVHYLPNGIDLDAWDRARRAPCPIALEPGAFHVGCVGRLEPQKNHALLIEALGRIGAERLRDWRVWLVGGATGDPAYAARLLAEIERRGLAGVVRLVEPQREIAALLERFDLLVLPSRYEGFPNVLLEAMACGLPVVATAVGDVPNLLRSGEAGRMVAPGDADALARELVEMRARPEAERRRMGQAARAVVEERYRIETVAAQHLDFYARQLAAQESRS